MEKNGAPPPLQLKEMGYEVELTIGMPTYNDYDGVYFTLQALKAYHDCENVEFIVIDNYGCKETKRFVERFAGGKYFEVKDNVGTAYAKNLIFEKARGNAVLVLDCHVVLEPEAIRRLKKYYRQHPRCMDLLQGPLWHDNLKTVSTHFAPRWRGEMYGTWAYDEKYEKGMPFEIPMQGMGLFSCRKDAWLGFNPKFKGFGGEEGYIHEKFRQAGNKCLCMPWLKWVHRFGRPNGIPYSVKIEDKIKNYIIGWYELGLDLAPIVENFSSKVTLSKMINIISEALGKPMNILIEEDTGEDLNNLTEEEKNMVLNDETAS